MASDSPAALSASLSPYGVQDMTGEELRRYERSGAVSPADSRLSQSRHVSHSEAIYPPTPAFRLVSERTTGAMHQCILVRSTEEEGDDDDEEEEGQVTSEPSIRHDGGQVDETSIVSIKWKRSPTPPLIHLLEHSTDEADQRASEATADGENEIDLEPSISDKDTEPRKRKRYPSADLDVAPLSKSKGPLGQEVSRFRGAIVCRSLKEAIDFAKSMGNGAPRTGQIHRHIFWTDASIVFRACAAGAVVWKQPPNWHWQAEGFPYPYCIQSTDVVEMFAMAHALKRAIDEVEWLLGGISDGPQLQIRHEVYVFTDSVGALTQVKKDSLGYHTPQTCQQAHTIIDFSVKLHDLGVKVELHLVPGHNSVPGNVQAHRAAKKAAKSAAAAAGIFSPEQASDLYKTQRGVAIFAPATDVLVPASQVPARSTKKSKTQCGILPRHLSLSRPLISNPIRAVTPPALVPPVYLNGQSGGHRETEEMITLLFPNPDFIRPDRTPDQSPEPTPTPGSDFTHINAGSISLSGSASVNTSLKLSTVGAVGGKIAQEPVATSSPSQVQSSRALKKIRQAEDDSPAPLTKVSSAQDTSTCQSPFHWFVPVNARSNLPTAGLSQPISLNSQKLVFGKQLEPGTVGAESMRSSQGTLFPMAPVALRRNRELTSTDEATVPLEAREFPFGSANGAPGAVLQFSAVRKSCLVPATTVAPPRSFAQTSKMRSFGSPTEPTKGLTLAPASPLKSREWSHLPPLSPSRPRINMQSFASPGSPRDDLTLPPLLSFDGGETKPGEDVLPSLSSVASNMHTSTTAFVQPSQMRQFASPREYKDALPLRPISTVCQSESKHPINTTLFSPPPSRPGICNSFTPIFKSSKMRSFASPVEPIDGLTLTPMSSIPESGPANPKPTLPMFRSSQPGIFDTTGSIVGAAKMKSFASPVEPVDGFTLRPISSASKSESAPTKAI